MSRQCRSCGHDYNDHGRRGGRCSHDTFTEETVDSGNPIDGIEIRAELVRCDCAYFVGGCMPATS